MQNIGHLVEKRNYPQPTGARLVGNYAALEPVSAAKHARYLYTSIASADPSLWTYMPYGPFESESAFTTWLTDKEKSHDPWFNAYIPLSSGKANGVGSFMRHDAINGVIELGHIWFSPSLQKTRESTEVIFLMMRHAFDDLNVRRLEWKCDALNAPSRRAAQRYGFTFEGIFRQHLIVKGRNRDTAWFAIIDEVWPRIRKGFEAWLNPSNFDAKGREKAKLQVT